MLSSIAGGADLLAPTTVVSPSPEQLAEAHTMRAQGKVAPQPTFLVNVPSVLDPHMQPTADQHVLSLEVLFTPYALEGGWQGSSEPARWLERARRTDGARNPADSIGGGAMTPDRYEAEFSMHRGHTPSYAGPPLSAFFGRQRETTRYRTPITGLYLSGAGTFPGAGVFGASGRNAADAVEHDLRGRGRRFTSLAALSRPPAIRLMASMITIADPDDIRVADYRQLNDQAARRVMEGDEYFLAEGWMTIERLIDSGHRFRSVLLSPSRATRFLPYLDRSELDGIPVFIADREVMRSIVGFDLPKAVLISASRLPLTTVEDLAASTSRLVVLEGLNDNENVGAIARAARAFGVDGIILSPTCTDPYYRRTVRVSMGEILHMRLARVARKEWPSALETLHSFGFETWAMTPADDAIDLWQAEVPDRLAIVLGAEGPGLTPPVMAAATRRVRIPISPNVDSLNVGHAAAVTLAAISRS